MTEQAQASPMPTEDGDLLSEAKATTLGAYLIIARYNRDKWNYLAKMHQDEAHETAEVVFPEHDPLDLPQNKPASGTLHMDEEPLKGVRMLHSFHSNMFAMLIERLKDNETPPTGTKEASEVVDDLFVIRKSPAGTHEKDPGIGWFAVVEAAYFPAFVNHLGTKEGPLWRMYDIEVIPLNDDKTTKDIYAFMTPVSWGK
jgi:hypothetical protein